MDLTLKVKREVGGPFAGWTIPVVGVVAVLVVCGILVTGGSPIAAVAPPLGVGLIFAVAKLPLRWSTTTLVFLLLALDVSSDANGIWSTPLVSLGDMLAGDGLVALTHVPLSGFEVAVAVLLALAAIRRARCSKVDGEKATQTASVMRGFMIVYVGACFFVMAVGVANGLGLALWKAKYLLHIPFFFLLFQTAYRGPEDFHAVGVAVVAAAHVKALIAAYVQLVAAPRITGGRLAYATNHGDSILFALAVLIILAPLLERWSFRRAGAAALLLPVPLWGMLLNGRRLVWAILAMAVTVIFVVTSWRPWKSRIVRVALVAAPLLIGYLGFGWNHTGAGGIFTPIAKIRTMLDAKVDRSTLWRARETWNIATSIRQSSFLGIGLGGEYTEYIFNDDISDSYPDYRGWPHNAVLGLLLLAGVPGFVALWLPYLLTVFLALGSERRARTPEDRSAAVLCVAAIVACLAIAWGDTGAHFIQYKLAAAMAMALSAKLAVATGAWPSRPSGRK